MHAKSTPHISRIFIVEHDGIGRRMMCAAAPCFVLVTSRNLRVSLPMKGVDEE
jgi:hypothetical protein